MKSTKRLPYLLIILITVSLISCRKADDSNMINKKNIELGVILPLDQEKGLLRQNALTLAIEEINKSGGIGDGHQIILKISSSEGDDRREAAAQAAQKLVNESENMPGLISCFSSSSLGIVEQLSIPHSIPTISGAATSTELSGISGYFQRLCPPDEFEATVLSEQARSYGIASVAIAVEDGDAYSENLGIAFQEAFGAGAGKKIEFSSEDPNYADKLDQLLADNPEAIFVSMLNQDHYTAFFTRLDQLNTKDQLENLTFILCDALYTGELFLAPIDYMLGEINGHPKNFGAYPSTDTASGVYLHFKEKLFSTFSQEVASYNAQFYDIGYLYALALEKSLQKADMADLPAFRKTLADFIRPVSKEPGVVVSPDMGWATMKAECNKGEINYKGASGNCDIDSEGNAATAYAIFSVEKTGDAFSFEILKIIP